MNKRHISNGADTSQKYPRKKRTSRRFMVPPIFLYALMSVTFGLLLASALITTPVLGLRTTSLSGTNLLLPEEIEESKKAMQLFAGMNVLLFSEQQCEARLRKLPYLADATVKKSFPNSLNVTLRARVPIAILESKDFGNWEIDSEATPIRVVSGEQKLQLPRMELDLKEVPTPGISLLDVLEEPYAKECILTVFSLMNHTSKQTNYTVVKFTIDPQGKICLNMRGMPTKVIWGSPSEEKKKIKMLEDFYLTDHHNIRVLNLTQPENPAVETVQIVPTSVTTGTSN